MSAVLALVERQPPVSRPRLVASARGARTAATFTRGRVVNQPPFDHDSVTPADRSLALRVIGLWQALCEPLGLPDAWAYSEHDSPPPWLLEAVLGALRPHRTLGWWDHYFRRIAAAPFCRGERSSGGAFDLEQALSERTINTVLSGRYDDRRLKCWRHPGSNLMRAEHWLRTFLRDGPQRIRDIVRAGKEHGFSYDQLKRARVRIGIYERRGQIKYWGLAPMTLGEQELFNADPSNTLAQPNYPENLDDSAAELRIPESLLRGDPDEAELAADASEKPGVNPERHCFEPRSRDEVKGEKIAGSPSGCEQFLAGEPESTRVPPSSESARPAPRTRAQLQPRGRSALRTRTGSLADAIADPEVAAAFERAYAARPRSDEK